MIEPADPRVKTGVSGLDDILYGGISRGNIVLIEGAAGTGKTTLGFESVYRGAADYDEPGLVVSFEMTPQKLIRDARGFGWDVEALQKTDRLRLILTSPQVLLEELQSADSVLFSEIRKLGARRVLIDGLSPLKLVSADDARSFREGLQLLIDSLQQMETTALLTRELPSHDNAPLDFGHEEFLCDTVIMLRHTIEGRTARRSLEISKSRGQDYISGRHTLRIESGRGVRVYRRAQARGQILPIQPTSTRRLSTGNGALDRMVGGGFYEGSVTLVVGISGTGKTVLGTQFLTAGAEAGERGLMITLDEHPAQLNRNADGLDLGFNRHVESGNILLHYDQPYELELDVHFNEITALIERHDIKRVLIDSIAAYQFTVQNDFHSFVYALTTYLKNRLATAVFSFESPELLGVSQISEELKASTIVDNIILLNYVETGNRLRRALTVPKARGSAPVRDTHEYVISSGGIKLLDDAPAGIENDVVPQLPFSAYYGILARSPARRSPLIEESVLHGEDLPSIADAEADADADADADRDRTS